MKVPETLHVTGYETPKFRVIGALVFFVERTYASNTTNKVMVNTALEAAKLVLNFGEGELRREIERTKDKRNCFEQSVQNSKIDALNKALIEVKEAVKDLHF